jgi:hypothetical protein
LNEQLLIIYAFKRATCTMLQLSRNNGK